jgi:hypothetical protein
MNSLPVCRRPSVVRLRAVQATPDVPLAGDSAAAGGCTWAPVAAAGAGVGSASEEGTGAVPTAVSEPCPFDLGEDGIPNDVRV